jgi:hypothetical protein
LVKISRPLHKSQLIDLGVVRGKLQQGDDEVAWQRGVPAHRYLSFQINGSWRHLKPVLLQAAGRELRADRI